MQIRIERSDDSLTSQELKELLEKLPEWDNSIKLEVIREQHLRLKNIDPTVVTAILTMAGTALGALISGLLKIAQANHKERIVLVTKDGLRIEVEARHALDKIPELIKLLRSMELEVIRM